MAYSTKQYHAVLGALEADPHAAMTAAELAEALRRSGCPVGLATIYRQLEKLESAGCIHKIPTEEGALYQYCPHQGGEHDCFLLRCECCSRIVHLDCGHLEELCRHLEHTHRFRIDPRRTVLTGRCDRCAGKEAACD
ncbi:MAG: transcriptional repressor [Ruminococcaceae bacterium]|nr:transcriptional repressor [Oscillospiraceae bacterium]